MSMTRGWMSAKLNATRTPTEAEIAWAAGIYEGEGTCCAKVTTRTIKGKTYGGVSEYLSVTQKDPEVLHRLREMFGGSVYEYTLTESAKYAGQTFSRWTIHGQRARNFIGQIYPWLSQRRKEQIEAASATILAKDTQVASVQEELVVGG